MDEMKVSNEKHYEKKKLYELVIFRHQYDNWMKNVGWEVNKIKLSTKMELVGKEFRESLFVEFQQLDIGWNCY